MHENVRELGSGSVCYLMALNSLSRSALNELVCAGPGFYVTGLNSLIHSRLDESTYLANLESLCVVLRRIIGRLG